jgi:hypothetical protein
MKKQFVVDPLISKKQQLLLAVQLVRQILKVRPISLYLSSHSRSDPIPMHRSTTSSPPVPTRSTEQFEMERKGGGTIENEACHLTPPSKFVHLVTHSHSQ